LHVSGYAKVSARRWVIIATENPLARELMLAIAKILAVLYTIAAVSRTITRA